MNPNKFGSFEKYCLGNGAYLRHAGHQHFACFKGDACQVLQAELDNSGSIFLNKYFNNLGIISTLKLIKYLRRHDVDVVHFHFYPIFSFFTLVSRLLPCKVYFSYRISGDFSRNGFVVRLLKKIRSKVLGIGIDGVFCVSGFARDKFIHNYLADPEIAKVVHNGLNWNFFKLGKKDHGTDEENGLQIICVAALIKDKGIIDVIDAVRLVCEKIPAWQLTVVGDGEDRQELESLVKSSRLESNVSFLGSRDDVPELLNRSDVAVAPSRWGEAFGFTVIEAMAAGL
ncbi:MAG: glycosyltransferase family 4 protein, partial [Gammaproteobacteria bacterium]|nr:glycosyltransferase family 4 protein [Gammaproteobacteria bacterium]